jgi:hypothetical protein
MLYVKVEQVTGVPTRTNSTTIKIPNSDFSMRINPFYKTGIVEGPSVF